MARKRKFARVYPHVVVRHNVICQSERHPSGIDRIVIHDTEGANIKGIRDLEGLGNYFDIRATEASSHTGGDAEGQSARFVPDDKKAWHCFNDNSRSLGHEQIGYASQTSWPLAQVLETARWVALWSNRHGIPIDEVHVVTHASLGVNGGGHHDPGTNYPMKRMRRYARIFKTLQRNHHKHNH